MLWSFINEWFSFIGLTLWLLIGHLSEISIHTLTPLTEAFIVSTMTRCISTINPVQWVISGFGNPSLS